MGLLDGIGSLLGGLFGGGQQQAAAPQQPVRLAQVPSPEDDARLIAAWEGWQQQMTGGGQKATGFDPMVALLQAQGGKAPAPMQQTSNQRGGQSFPAVPGQGLYRDDLGPGRGAGGGNNKLLSTSPVTQQKWHDLLAGLISGPQAQQYTAPAQTGFNTYMQQALAGNAGLSPEARQQALLSGERTLNAQAANSRESLSSNLGARGLLSSGLEARGLRGVEEARVGGIGDLISGLAQQDAQARIEAQRQAAGLFPSLISAQTGATGQVLNAWLAQQGYDLERGRLKLQKTAAQQASDDAFWGALGSVAGMLFPLGGTSPDPYANKYR